MPNYASVTIVGHLGKQPETRYTSGGESVTSFSLATTVNRKKDNELTTWWNCTAWGKRGETIAQYLRKGDPILVQGEPSLRTYTTKDGRDGMALDVNVQGFSFLGGKDDRQTGQEPRGDARGGGARVGQGLRSAAPQAAPAAFDDDIPF